MLLTISLLQKKGLRWFFLLTLPFLACMPAKAQLIKGNIPNGEKMRWADILYYPDFNFFNSSKTPISFSATGDFSWDTQLPLQFGLVEIQTDKDSKKIIVRQGTTMTVYTKQDNAGKRRLAYSGPNESVTRYIETLEHATSITAITGYGMPEDRVTKDVALRVLDETFAKMHKLLKKVKDKDARQFAAHYTDMLYMHYKLEIVCDHGDTHVYAQYPDKEYQRLVATVNPNEPVNLRWRLPHKWVYNQIDPALAQQDDLTDYALRYLEVMRLAVTDQLVKHSLLDDLLDRVISQGNPKDVDRFWNPIKEYAPNDTELLNKYTPKIEALKKTRAGKMAPEQTFNDIDGKSFRLSDFRGKVLYIDVWATWCVPCKNEIPHFAKVAEHYKDNPNIQLISISTDRERDHEKWRKMIADEKPAWPQFVMKDAEHEKFAADFNIRFIPRFIIINADGTIQNADAPRPSDKDIIRTLDEIIAKNNM